MKLYLKNSTILCLFLATSMTNLIAMNDDKYSQSSKLINKIMYGKDLSNTKIVINAKKAFPDVPLKPLSDDLESCEYGDMFQFYAAYVAHCKNYGATDIAVNVPKFLHNLYNECSNLKLITNKEDDRQQIELSTMYEILGSGPKTFKPEKPYLQPKEERVDKWMEIIAENSKGDLPVVFFHDGNRKHNADRFLESEDVDYLVKNIDGVQFFNAQFYEKNEKPFEYDHVLRPSVLVGNFNKDGAFTDDAAMVAATLRLGGVIITQDTGTHWLSAAVGEGLKGHDKEYITKKIWTLIKAEPDQRHLIKWGNTGHKSIWSPRITRLYRQKKVKEGWRPKIKEIREDIKILATYKKNFILDTL